jgi:hypothetical protein
MLITKGLAFYLKNEINEKYVFRKIEGSIFDDAQSGNSDILQCNNWPQFVEQKVELSCSFTSTLLSLR